MGRHLSPRFGQVIVVSEYNIDVQSAFSWAPKVARKCESKHWYACGADGRSVRRSVCRSRDYQIFWAGMGRFIYPWCSANIRLSFFSP